MGDLIRKRSATERLIIAKTLLESVLQDMPTAEPRPGKWIEKGDDWEGVYYECSCCKEAFTLIDGTPTDNLYNYCPNCGTKMEESNG